MVATPTNWSLAREPWQALRDLLDVEPLSWSSAPFQQAASAAVPDSPGIYLVCAQPAAGLAIATPYIFNVLYVGQASRSIRDRFNYHLSHQAKPKMKKAREVFGNKLAFYWTATCRFREFEPLIYDAFGPPINDTSPPRLKGILGSPRAVQRRTEVN